MRDSMNAVSQHLNLKAVLGSKRLSNIGKETPTSNRFSSSPLGVSHPSGTAGVTSDCSSIGAAREADERLIDPVLTKGWLCSLTTRRLTAQEHQQE
ncbi:hypothetical protein OPT61_g8694 [Boeremia exigua]|uniref:Uncharacterized protein n=1 Tax=Boeremia exigua TaxID=749465 RepID=A0ACC2HY25_9PLEO|nr:hypothetical protein OPT61_g8694 [Boeremia exigua]